MQMIFWKNNYTLALVITLLALSVSTASGRTARAIFVGATADSPKEATLVAGESQVTIPLPRRYLSSEFELPNGALNMAVLANPPLPDTEIDPAAPVLVIPEEYGRCLLLFIPDPRNKTFPARVIAIDTSPSIFKEGHSVIYNLSNFSVAGQFGERQLVVPPRKRRALKPPVSDAGGYPVKIACQASEDSNWITICHSTWVHNPQARQLIFITSSDERQTPRVWSVFDTSK